MDILIIVGVILLVVILSYTTIKYFIFNAKLKEKIDILINTCENLIDTEHYDDVIKYCADFLSENIEFKKYRLICFSKIYIARAYLYKNNFQETIKITTDIIKQGKSDYIQFSAYSFRALSYINIEQNFKAINDLSNCVNLRQYAIDRREYNDVLLLYYLRGSLHFSREKYNLAISNFTNYLSLYKKYKNQIEEAKDELIEVLLQRAKAFLEINSFNESIRDCSKIITIDKENEYAYFIRAISSLNLIDYTKEQKKHDNEKFFNSALEDLETVLTINPDNTEAKEKLIEVLLQRTSAFLETNSFNEAINDCSRVITMDNENEYAYFIRAISSLNLIDDTKKQDNEMLFNNALKDLETVLTINPDNTEAKEIYESITENQEDDQEENFDWKGLVRDIDWKGLARDAAKIYKIYSRTMKAIDLFRNITGF